MSESRQLEWIKVCCHAGHAPLLASALEHHGLSPKLTRSERKLSAAQSNSRLVESGPAFDLWVPQEQVALTTEFIRIHDARSWDTVDRAAYRGLAALYYDMQIGTPNPAPAQDENLEERTFPMNQIIDPVCGMTVNPAKTSTKSEYKGTTYHFCSLECKQQFDAEPAQYAHDHEDHENHKDHAHH